MAFAAITIKPTDKAKNEEVLAEFHRILRDNSSLPYKKDRIGFNRSINNRPAPSAVVPANESAVFDLVSDFKIKIACFIAVVIVDENSEVGEGFVFNKENGSWKQVNKIRGKTGQYGNDVSKKIEKRYSFAVNASNRVVELDDYDDNSKKGASKSNKQQVRDWLDQ